MPSEDSRSAALRTALNSIVNVTAIPGGKGIWGVDGTCMLITPPFVMVTRMIIEISALVMPSAYEKMVPRRS